MKIKIRFFIFDISSKTGNANFFAFQIIQQNFKKGKLITPSQEEIKINNRARSAKLRIATLKKPNV